MSHTLQAVAWTLIHFCWQAAAIAALYRVASFALQHRSSNTRYVAALSALLLMFAAAVATFSWEARTIPAPSLAPANATIVAHNGFRMAPARTPAIDAPNPAGPSFFGSLSPSLLLWIDACWLAGVLALSFRSMGGWWILQRLRVSATVDAPAAAVASFQRIARALGLRRAALLRVSSAIAGPMTIGALRTLVLLPLSAATSLSPEELEVVLAHERELCCDDLALRVCPDPLVYARALFRLEEQRTSQWQLAMALDGHQSGRTLRARIARILGEPLVQTASRTPFSFAAAGALLVILLLPVPQVLAKLNPVAATPAAHPAASPAPAAVAGPSASDIAIAVPQPHPQVAVADSVQEQAAQDQAAPASSGHKGGDYIDQMKAAGYDVDLDKMIALKTQDVTPEYARQMSQLGFGKLSADQLIACKVQDVDADYIAKMKAAGYNADIDKYIAMKVQDITPEYAQKMAQLGFGKLSADDLIAARIQDVNADYIDKMKASGYNAGIDKYIAMKIQDVTPDYAEKMSQLGFGKLSADDLIAAKIQDVTPEYLAKLKSDGLEVKSIQDAISYRIFDVTPEFVAGMKAAGYDNLDHNKLMALRVQGVTPEYARAIRQQYPGATVDDIVKTKIFNINAEFIASAKRHGFTDLSLDKLVKLRISGLLDDEDSKK